VPIPVDWNARFETWLIDKSLREDGGWIPLKPALKALGESCKNPGRYVEAGSDAPGKLWLVGQLKRVPRQNLDYKRGASVRGGCNPFLVRKTFLKEVVLERFKHKL
jgi:hypothetical protein